MQIVINIRKKDIMFLLVGLIVLGGSAMLYASTVTIPNTFSSATTAKASEVNANFTAIKTAVDDNANTKAPTASPTFTGTTTTVNLVKTCPTGFTSIVATASSDSIVRQLGCMQTAEEGTGTWETAADDCWTTYSARLPVQNEWYIAANNYALTDETDDWEWNAENDYFSAGNEHALSGSGAVTNNNASADSNTFAYRCFIPT